MKRLASAALPPPLVVSVFRSTDVYRLPKPEEYIAKGTVGLAGARPAKVTPLMVVVAAVLSKL